MKLYEARDIIRENIGRDKAPEHFFKWSMEQGLRELEKLENWYWMEAISDETLVVDRQVYSVTAATSGSIASPTSSASGGFSITNYKDAAQVLAQDSTLTDPIWDEVYGPRLQEVLEQQYASTDEGFPEQYSFMENSNGRLDVAFWPPKPDKTYAVRIYHYTWTSLPTDITTDTHEVLLRWPEALIYLSTAAGLEALTKDPQAGAFWRSKFADPQMGELAKLHRYNFDRTYDNRMELVPYTGGVITRFPQHRSSYSWAS